MLRKIRKDFFIKKIQNSKKIIYFLVFGFGILIGTALFPTLQYAQILSSNNLQASTLNSSNTSAFVFTKTLKIGVISPDVKILQQILNSDQDTVIALAGPGSNGQESSYFGNLTKRAVIKFQNKYPQDILIPAGLSIGNGLVGPLTIKKLNQILVAKNNGDISQNQNYSSSSPNSVNLSQYSQYQVSDAEKIDVYATDKKIQEIQGKISSTLSAAALSGNVKVDVNSFFKDLSPVLLYTLSANTGNPGTPLTINGVNFNGTNSIYFGNNYILRSISGTNSQITLTVPNLPPGKYDLVVKNSQGQSNSKSFVITSPASKKVVIQSITPSKVNYGDTITIHGSGFAASNDLITSLGRINNIISQDGTTITITLTPDSLKPALDAHVQGKEISDTIYIVNDNGYTADPGVATVVY